MLQIGGEEHMTVSVTWPKVLAIVLPIVVTLAGGYWLLIEHVIGGISTSVSELRADASTRFEGHESEDRDIRGVIQKHKRSASRKA